LIVKEGRQDRFPIVVEAHMTASMLRMMGLVFLTLLFFSWTKYGFQNSNDSSEFNGP